MNTNHKATQPGTQRLPLIVATTLIATIASMAIAAGCRPPANRATVRTELMDLRAGNARSDDWVEDWGGRGEEPYFAVIKFRTTLGLPNSTSAWLATDPDRLWTGYPGSPNNGAELSPGTAPIPIRTGDGQNTVHIASQVNLAAALANGTMPINGTIIVGLDADVRGWERAIENKSIRHMFRGAADNLERDLAVLEDSPWSLQALSDLQNTLRTFAANAPRHYEGRELRDDIIGAHIIVNVGALPDYYDAMRPQLDALGVAGCDGSYRLTQPAYPKADYYLSVCPDKTQTLDLLFDGGPGSDSSGQWYPTNYAIRVEQTLLTGIAATY